MTETQGVKYIGSKASLLPYILRCIDEAIPVGSIQRTIDCFTGTTRVAQAFKGRGWHVQTSDLSWAAAAYSGTWIANDGPYGHLQTRIDQLNALPGVDGWLTRNYCDVHSQEGDGVVRVWQPKNGRRADAIRDQIELWFSEGTISAGEKNALVTCLILALDKVDNTVGVQQAYLKDWCDRSYKDLLLELPRTCVGAPKGKHWIGNCLEIPYDSADLAYLDPPYSAHSYATYYHIWDSIALWDKPEVGLKTNRRIDRISGHSEYDTSMSSEWNSKKSCLAAFDKLITGLPVRWILISYNNESLIDAESLMGLLRAKNFNSISVSEVDYKRNIMCKIGNAVGKEGGFHTKNKEYLFLIEK